MDSKKITINKTYSLEIIKEWANDDEEWMLGFIKLLVQEVEIKLIRISACVKDPNTKKLAFELHQLASQLGLLGNEEINKLLSTIESSSIRSRPMSEIDLLINKTKSLMQELKADFSL